MNNKHEFQINIPRSEIVSESVLGNFEEFMKNLKERANETRPEEVEMILEELERYSQTPDRSIEIYTGPDLDSFCCGQVPAQTINLEGDIVDDPKKKCYLIGIPFIFVAGRASMKFLQGEILHERGHAEFTDYAKWKRFEILADKDGYDAEELKSLDNCIEDPRMERLVGGPLKENARKLLFEKNRHFIIPNIANGINKKEMSPTEQFKFIIKLERIWALHEKDLAGEKKPWSLDNLHPRTREEYEKVKPILEQITGSAVKPSMKVNAEVEKLIVEHIWPALKRLIDEFPEKKEKKDRDSGEGGEGRGKQHKRGKTSEQGKAMTDPNIDPSNPSSWPPELNKVFQKMIEKHNKRLQKKAEKEKEKAQKKEKEKNEKDKERHELMKTKDGFEDPLLRDKYNDIKNEVRPLSDRIERIFNRFLPKVDELEYVYSKRGTRFEVSRYVRRIGTGHEDPMGRKENPEKKAFIIQVLIDVSGSMYGNRARIENAVKACVSLAEASSNFNVFIEILANDDGNIDHGNGKNLAKEYLIKSFDQPFDGRAKSNIVKMMTQFGGDNKDDEAIKAAVPRMMKKIQELRSEYDRISALIVYVSDSTTQSKSTKKEVDEARRFFPLEGTAITSEGEIPAMVKFHFGPESMVPKSVEEFPELIQELLQKHTSRLRESE